REAEELLGATLEMPRLCLKQQNRANPLMTKDNPLTPADYYRRVAYIPLLDNLISQFKDRFTDHRTTAMKLSSLLPKFVPGTDFCSVIDAVKFYLPVLQPTGVDCNIDIDDVECEFVRWKSRWQISAQSDSDRPQNCLDALACCDINFYPVIHALLTIFACLPVSTATPERTFSALKLLKTYLRSRMTDENLQGLAMAYIHKKMHINIEDVIDQFAVKNRRLQFN